MNNTYKQVYPDILEDSYYKVLDLKDKVDIHNWSRQITRTDAYFVQDITDELLSIANQLYRVLHP